MINHFGNRTEWPENSKRGNCSQKITADGSKMSHPLWLAPRWSLTPKPIKSANIQAGQDVINTSETFCSTIIQSFWISQVLLFSTDLLKRVMTGIANQIAMGIAQLNQTNKVICLLSSFFSKIYPMAAKKISGLCGSIFLIREVQKQRKEQLKKVERQ